jgi:ferric-dicitrate binding protein FerR (iron transport regulator)
MKKLAIGCLIALVLLGIAGFAAWRILPPLLNKAMNSVVNQAQNAALKQMGMSALGSTTGTAYLTDLNGDVYVTHAGQRADASQGPVAEGDEVETASGASATLIWPDYGRTVLDANSKLVVTQANKTGDNLNVKLKLNAGRIWTRLERLLGAGSGFEVRASNVVATVRGTSFGVDNRVGGNVSIQVAESHVGIQKMRTEYSDEAVGEMIVGPGQQASVDENIRTAMPQAAVMSNAVLNDPFLKQGNTKIDPALMSWVSKAMELYNSIPQGRAMTPDEEQALEQKAMDLWSTLPEQYKNQDTINQVTK